MRPNITIPLTVESPFPIYNELQIISGFGRGSSDLGIPTANIPVDESLKSLEPGVYFGWCRLHHANSSPVLNESLKRNNFTYGANLTSQEKECFPMVMSIGWNPFYKNEEKTAEIHIMHKFECDFYGAIVKFAILGYIRPELDYTTKGTYFFRLSFLRMSSDHLDALIEDIYIDMDIAKRSLSNPSYQTYRSGL